MKPLLKFKTRPNVFAFSLNIEGTTEKMLQFILSLKSIYNNNLGLIEQKCIFEHYREIQTVKNQSNVIVFAMNFFGDLFRAAFYWLMLVLN